MKKINYNIDYFLLNDDFLSWVTQPTAESTAYWEKWIENNPDQKKNIFEAKCLLSSLTFSKHELSVDKKVNLFQAIERRTTGKEVAEVYKDFRQSIEGLSSEENSTKLVKMPIKKQSFIDSWNWIFISRIAASLILLAAFSSSVYYYLSITGVEGTAVVNSKVIVKQNPIGQRLTTYLPDGTKVILNSNSKVTYGPDFGAIVRKVQLEGEAFFEVARDSSIVFTVIARGVETHALGTNFNVRAVDQDVVEVSLVSGKVVVQFDTVAPVVLSPGKSAYFSKNGDVFVKKFDYQEVVGWKDGVLVFKDNSLPEIIEKLENWYGVEIQSELVMDNHFSYSGINKNETLDEVLKGISFVHHFNYEIDEDVIRLY